MVKLPEAQAKCLQGNLSRIHKTNNRAVLLPPGSDQPSAISSLLVTNETSSPTHFASVTPISSPFTDHFSCSVPSTCLKQSCWSTHHITLALTKNYSFRETTLESWRFQPWVTSMQKGSASNSKGCKCSFIAVFPSVILIWVEYRSDHLLFCFQFNIKHVQTFNYLLLLFSLNQCQISSILVNFWGLTNKTILSNRQRKWLHRYDF